MDLLAGVPLFRGLDAAALEVVARDARLVKAASGRSFFREGEPAQFFYVVRTGGVKFTQISAEGHEVILRVIGPGEPFGGIRSALGASNGAVAEFIAPEEGDDIIVDHEFADAQKGAIGYIAVRSRTDATTRKITTMGH